MITKKIDFHDHHHHCFSGYGSHEWQWCASPWRFTQKTSTNRLIPFLFKFIYQTKLSRCLCLWFAWLIICAYEWQCCCTKCHNYQHLYDDDDDDDLQPCSISVVENFMYVLAVSVHFQCTNLCLDASWSNRFSLSWCPISFLC